MRREILERCPDAVARHAVSRVLLSETRRFPSPDASGMPTPSNVEAVGPPWRRPFLAQLTTLRRALKRPRAAARRLAWHLSVALSRAGADGAGRRSTRS
jgi:hypothetical protein